MIESFILGLIIALARTEAAPCVPTPQPGATEWQPSSAAVSLVGAPRRHFGDSVASVRRAAGEPARSTATGVENQHDPAVRDTIWRLEYPDAVLEVYVLRDGSRQFLLTVRLLHPRSDLPLAVGFEDTQESVRCALGVPALSTPNLLRYHGPDTGVGADTVDLIFQGDRLARIEWSYFLD